MKPHFRIFSRAALLALFAGLGGAALIATPTVQAQAPAAPAPPSAQDFGREAAIRGVNLSPDGKRIVAITSTDGVTPLITIWRTDAMDQKPTYLGCGERNTCQSARFIKPDRLLVSVRQTITSGATKTHLFCAFVTDLTFNSVRNISGDEDQSACSGAGLVDDLPKDPKNILVQNRDGIYKLNVYTGARAKVYTNSDKFGGEQTDLNGEVRARQSVDFENGRVYIAQWIRNPKTNNWEEHFRWFAADREPVDILGFTDNPDIIYIRTNRGQDKYSIFEYNIQTRKMEPAFGIKLFDATGVVQSNAPGDYGRLLGFTYDAASNQTYWVDGKLDAMTKGLRAALGVKTVNVAWTDIATGEAAKFPTADGADVFLTNWSDDLSYAIVAKTGASQPTEYYLLHNGGLKLLGKQRPWFDTRMLGDTRLVQYPARDGMLIPGFLTLPKAEFYGKGPFPTIILPHGGPWARDEMGWDGTGWVQYFAARGYAVLQPQFRGSEGWGQKLWRAGDKEWGQKMQDDMDDGAKWLISQGLAAPDRIAMHGYSYGGYAAMAAAVRPNGIYQCSIAGAGVAELDYFRENLNQNPISRAFQRPTIDGLQPLDHVGEVSIPIFLYHGDRDQTVRIEESERFVAGLKRFNKPYRFTVLKDMGHQSNRWEAGQITQVLTEIESYLRTDCGPGGL